MRSRFTISGRRDSSAWLSQGYSVIHIVELCGLSYLPSYSPELNPEERLNAGLKHAISSTVPARTKTKLKAVATAHMQELENAPERVMKFFQDPRVKYAA